MTWQCLIFSASRWWRFWEKFDQSKTKARFYFGRIFFTSPKWICGARYLSSKALLSKRLVEQWVDWRGVEVKWNDLISCLCNEVAKPEKTQKNRRSRKNTKLVHTDQTDESVTQWQSGTFVLLLASKRPMKASTCPSWINIVAQHWSQKCWFLTWFQLDTTRLRHCASFLLLLPAWPRRALSYNRFFSLGVTEPIGTFPLFFAVKNQHVLKSGAPRRKLRGCLTLGGASQKCTLDNFYGFQNKIRIRWATERRGKKKYVNEFFLLLKKMSKIKSIFGRKMSLNRRVRFTCDIKPPKNKQNTDSTADEVIASATESPCRLQCHIFGGIIKHELPFLLAFSSSSTSSAACRSLGRREPITSAGSWCNSGWTRWHRGRLFIDARCFFFFFLQTAW